MGETLLGHRRNAIAYGIFASDTQMGLLEQILGILRTDFETNIISRSAECYETQTNLFLSRSLNNFIFALSILDWRRRRRPPPPLSE